MTPEQISTFLQHIVNGISLGAIYALIALGYTMVYGILQLINFAHSDVFMVGAYFGYFSGLWFAAGVLPGKPVLLIGIPVGVFLLLLNHKALSKLLNLPAVKIGDQQLARTALLATISVIVAIGWFGGHFVAGPQAPETLLGMPTTTVLRTLGAVLVLAGPLLLATRGLAPHFGVSLVAATIIGAIAFYGFPYAAALTKLVQIGAVRAKADGTVASVKIRQERQVTVVVGQERYALEVGDEESVKKGAEITAGQSLSAKGVKATAAGTVTNLEVNRLKFNDVTVGSEVYPIPPEQSTLVKTGDAVSSGQKLSSGIQLLSPFLVLAFAMVGCAVLGFLIERIAYRPLRHAPRINSLITAIGMSLLLVNSAQMMFGADPKGFPQIIPPLAPLKFGNVQVDPRQLTVLIVAVVLMIVLQYVVYYTRLGLGMRAVSYNHAWAGLMGVPVDNVITATFMIGSALAGAAGILVGVTYVMIQPHLGVLLGLKAFVAAVLGGIGSLPGALLGGLLMGLSEEMVAGYMSSSFRDAIAFLILILILLVRPAGLLGKSAVEKV